MSDTSKSKVKNGSAAKADTEAQAKAKQTKTKGFTELSEMDIAALRLADAWTVAVNENGHGTIIARKSLSASTDSPFGGSGELKREILIGKSHDLPESTSFDITDRLLMATAVKYGLARNTWVRLTAHPSVVGVIVLRCLIKSSKVTGFGLPATPSSK